MATQGLVSILQVGKVVMKFVAGCDGYNINNLAEAVRESGLPNSLAEAQKLALDNSFGNEDTLVVMNGELLRYRDEEFSDFPEEKSLYRETFADPLFNPRRDSGKADHSILIYL